uniref:Formylglycine-generating enzyme, required for sulfatase activity, contains SUMF1/FGE domain n=1 Tax=Candidatus Kentrum sp. TUN TaxID=2126343 RepID=A0A450ZLR3_9GAMM|nr:MAG: Formylglycine-generating enzyme, required for sulfatase activity, contains SUMF1/FGE domain [Candidatus Kentron sp. TUN]
MGPPPWVQGCSYPRGAGRRGITVFDSALPRRGYVCQPRVAAKPLPWVIEYQTTQPQRGCVKCKAEREINQIMNQVLRTVYHAASRIKGPRRNLAGVFLNALLGLCLFISPLFPLSAGVDSFPAEARSPLFPLAYSQQPCRTTPGDPPEIVVIPSGRFLMGSPEDEKGRHSDEGPQHGVSVVKPFAMSRCEITVGEFRTFVKETNCRTEAEGGVGCTVLKDDGSGWERRKDRNWRNPGFEQTQHHPVVCVNWHDARAYAYWLSLRTGHKYRLLTEAEWEYAARAVHETGVPTAGSPRYWGEDPENKEMCKFANGADPTLQEQAPNLSLSINENCRDGFAFTAPAASFRPNAFGLFDMLGNVWEWTADCLHGNYNHAPLDGSAWGEENNGDCGRRVIRGGSWLNKPWFIRSAYREGSSPNNADENVGFRLARDI